MLAKNLAYQALIAGYTVLRRVAGQLLGVLRATESDAVLRQRLRQYSAPDVLVIDEIGYLSCSNRHANLLFELLNRRYEKKSTIVPTNKPFAQWQEVFPSAGCVVSLVVDSSIAPKSSLSRAKSYRLKEAEERSDRNERRRRTPKATKKLLVANARSHDRRALRSTTHASCDQCSAYTDGASAKSSIRARHREHADDESWSDPRSA
jgi:hypothetical protein